MSGRSIGDKHGNGDGRGLGDAPWRTIAYDELVGLGDVRGHHLARARRGLVDGTGRPFRYEVPRVVSSA